MKDKSVGKLLLFFLFVLMTPLLAGCSLSFTSSGIKVEGLGDGGIFMTTNSGDSWKQVSAIPAINGQSRSLGSEDIKDIAIDPNDHHTLYLATIDRGLWYTNDIRNGWQQISSLEEKKIQTVQVDPQNKCTLYVLSKNKVFKTDNCGRDFQQIYQDDDEEVVLTTIAIDDLNNSNLYLGDSRGNILKSIDQGISWRVIKSLETRSPVMKILVNPKNSRQIFLASKDRFVYSFISNTKTNPDNSEEIAQNFAVNNFESYNSILENLEIDGEYRSLVISNDGELFLATNASLARSKDQGNTWEKLTILTTDDQVEIVSLVINPNDAKEIYYLTSNTIFRSVDNGTSWTTKKLPTTRSGSKLLIDYQDPAVIYLGVIQK